MLTADAVVVGAGVAGCTVAGRLAASGRRVLVVEAGADLPLPSELRRLDVGAASRLFAGSGSGQAATHQQARVWPNVAVGGDLSAHPYIQGRGVGGSAALNGGLLSAPTKLELDRWRDHHGCEGWDFASLSPWVEMAWGRLPSTHVVRSEAGRQIDLWAEGVGLITGAHTSLDFTATGSIAPVLAAGTDGDVLTRVGPFDAVNRSDNVQRLTGAVAERLVVGSGSGSGRAEAVQLTDGRLLAAGDFVVCAGALRSPMLLQRSGLLGDDAGRWDVLDHRSVALTFRWPTEQPAPRSGGRSALVHRVWRWHPDPSKPRTGRPDEAIAHFVGPFFGESPTSSARGVAIVSASASLRRSVEVHSSDVAGGLVLGECLDGDSGLNDAVVETLSDAVVVLAKVVGDSNGAPGPGVVDPGWLTAADRSAVGRWIFASPGPTYHVAGSLPLSSDADERGGVRCSSGEAGRLPGVDNVVVADASVLPELPAIGPQLTVMAVAERICTETLGCR